MMHMYRDVYFILLLFYFLEGPLGQIFVQHL